MVLTNSRNQTTGQIPQPLNPHVVGRGAYIDLGYMVNRRQLFSATLSEIASIGFDLSTAQPGGRVSTFSGLPAFVDDGNGILESGENFFYPSLPLSGVAGGAYQMGVDDGNTTVDTDEHLLLAYDTWSVSFESDGVDQDGDSVIDQASDGIDNDGVNGVDDVGELESPAPYDMPLNGMEVKIRMWHVGTGQVRQVSVVTDFSSAP
jgi:hypothetical protein